MPHSDFRSERYSPVRTLFIAIAAVLLGTCIAGRGATNRATAEDSEAAGPFSGRTFPNVHIAYGRLKSAPFIWPDFNTREPSDVAEVTYEIVTRVRGLFPTNNTVSIEYYANSMSEAGLPTNAILVLHHNWLDRSSWSNRVWRETSPSYSEDGSHGSYTALGGDAYRGILADTRGNRKMIADQSLLSLLQQSSGNRLAESVARKMALQIARRTAEKGYKDSPGILAGRECRLEDMLRYGYGWQCLVSWNTKALDFPLVETVVVVGDDVVVKTDAMIFNRLPNLNKIPPFDPKSDSAIDDQWADTRVWSCPRMEQDVYTPAALLKTANTLIQAGAVEAEAELQALATAAEAPGKRLPDYWAYEKLIMLCRVLYEPAEGRRLRPPTHSHPMIPFETLDAMTAENWPSLPLAFSRGIPFLMLENHTLIQGKTETGASYLMYCRKNGKFRRRAFVIPSEKDARSAADALLTSDRWRRLRWSASGGKKGGEWSYTIGNGDGKCQARSIWRQAGEASRQQAEAEIAAEGRAHLQEMTALSKSMEDIPSPVDGLVYLGTSDRRIPFDGRTLSKRDIGKKINGFTVESYNRKTGKFLLRRKLKGSFGETTIDVENDRVRTLTETVARVRVVETGEELVLGHGDSVTVNGVEFYVSWINWRQGTLDLAAVGRDDRYTFPVPMQKAVLNRDAETDRRIEPK